MRGHLAVSVVCGAALTGLILFQAWLVARAVAGASDGATPTTLAPLVAGVAGVALARAVLAYGAESAALRSAARAKSQLRVRLVRHLAAHPPGPDGPGAGEIVTLATRGLDALDDYVARYLPQLVLAVLVPVAVLVVIADADRLSALVVLVTLPLIPLFMALVGMHTRARTRRQWHLLSRLGGHFLDVVQGLPTLALFRRARAVAEKVRETTDAHRRATTATLRTAFLSAFVLEVLATLAVALVAVEVGLRLLAGNLDLETALLVLILAPEAYLPLREVGARFHASMEGVAAARQVFDVLDGPTRPAGGTVGQRVTQDRPDRSATGEAGRPEAGIRVRAGLALPSNGTFGRLRPPERSGRSTAGPAHPSDVTFAQAAVPERDNRSAPLPGITVERCSGPAGAGRSAAYAAGRPDVGGSGTGLELDGVTVRYPGRERPALDGLSVRVAPGESVLVRGPSGAGKSTLLAVLLRFVDVGAGTVRADGIDLEGIDPDAWRRTVAWVPQDPHLFAGSLADNIRLGEPDAPPDAVRRAARRAGLDGVAGALPRGYDTPLGENGARLSSGERQRVALARAFLRDAPLVLLDEPTAHLDEDTADGVRAAAAELLRGRTALVVAHDEGWAGLTDRTLTLPAPPPATRGTPDRRAAPVAWGAARRHEVRQLPDAAPAPTRPAPTRPAPTGPAPAGPTGPAGAGSGDSGSAGTAGTADRASTAPCVDGPVPGGRSPEGARTRPVRPVRHTTWSHLRPILRPRAGQIVAGAACGAVATACGAGLLSLAAWLIATAATHPPIAAISVAVVLTRALGVGRGLARYAERMVTHDAALRGLADARNRVYARLAAAGPVRRWRSGDLVSRLVTDTDAVQDLVVRGLVPPVAAALAGAGAVLLAGALLLPGGMVLAAGLLLAGVAVPVLAAAAGRGPGARAARERSRLATALVDTLHGAPDLIAYGAMGRAVDAVRDRDARLTAVARRDARLLGLGSGAFALVAGLTLAGSLLLGVSAVADGTLGAVPMAVLVLTALAAFEIVAPLPGLAARAGATRAGTRRLAEVLATPGPATDRGTARGAADDGTATGTPAGSRASLPPPVPPAAESSPLPTAGDLRVRGLTVAYPGGPPVLDDLDLDVPAGAHVALAGPSGAGKSTLAGVLFGFLGPDEVRAGSVTLGGVELLGRDPDDVRAVVSGVPQDPHVFDSTVRENLRLARPDATDAGLRAVLDRIGLDRLDLDEPVGTHGRRLSGGMRRRIAVARALLADPAVLVLDEPTAHLDPDTRDAVLDDLLDATRGRSVLLITHDPACLRRVDAVRRIRPARVPDRSPTLARTDA